MVVLSCFNGFHLQAISRQAFPGNISPRSPVRPLRTHLLPPTSRLKFHSTSPPTPPPKVVSYFSAHLEMNSAPERGGRSRALPKKGVAYSTCMSEHIRVAARTEHIALNVTSSRTYIHIITEISEISHRRQQTRA